MDQSLLACNFGGQNGFGSEIRLVALRLRPSRRAARRASFPLCCGGSTTLFDAEERLLKRSVRLLESPRIDLDHKRISETRGLYRFQHGSGARQRCRGRAAVSSPCYEGPGAVPHCGWQLRMCGCADRTRLSERTNWERRGDKKHLLPENRPNVELLPADNKDLLPEKRPNVRMLPAGFEPASEARKAPILDRTRLRERKAGLAP